MSDDTTHHVTEGMDPALRERIAARGRPITAEEFQAMVEADSARFLRERRRQAWASLVDAEFVDARVEDFTDVPGVAADLAAWGRAAVPRNLVILGPVGTGKTHAAVAGARVAFDHWHSVLVHSADDLLTLLRPGGPDGYAERLARVDHLVVDDVGRETATDWTEAQLARLLDRRWANHRPTAVTTNLTPADLEAHLGERAYSRLVGGAIVLRLSGADRRRDQAKAS